MTILSTWSLVVQEAKYHFCFMAQYATCLYQNIHSDRLVLFQGINNRSTPYISSIYNTIVASIKDCG
jgi:hypothetical protein